MKKIIFITLIFSAISSYAQEKLIINFKEQSWETTLATAKSTHQLVFIDVFTEWCGPCKTMDGEVFTLPEVAKIFNENFINFKLDAEKGIGPAILKKYGVSSYPTYLFVDSNGTLIYSMDGSMPPATFIQHAKNAIRESTQEQTIAQLESIYPQHQRDKGFLYNYLNRLTRLKLPTTDLLDHYVTLLSPSEQADPKTIRLITENGVWLNRKLQLGPALAVLERNESIFNKLQENDPRRESLAHIKTGAMDVSLQKAIANKDMSLFQLVSRLKKDTKSDPFDNKQTLAMKYFFAVKDYPAYKKNASDYINRTVLKIPADTLVKNDAVVYASMKSIPDAESYKYTASIKVSNTIIHTTEEMLKITLSKKELQQLKTWTDEALRITQTDPAYYKNVTPYYLNIDAQVLYKMHQKEQAIQQMKSAIQLVADNAYAVKKLQELLTKMEADEII
ncbi:thioredoxin family protein [Pedobacter duraquae]|uniref:Thioredoxin-like protein n=1 Tax=Pedobacter duraquae TaxID=425511 RepID=A0A4R6INW6_9SPHI|nr:thioredoxin family protein [Pedobacter duraquae]TDO23964.1 thioredoxin-like protein [Pedobacter duraquae]